MANKGTAVTRQVYDSVLISVYDRLMQIKDELGLNTEQVVGFVQVSQEFASQEFAAVVRDAHTAFMQNWEALLHQSNTAQRPNKRKMPRVSGSSSGASLPGRPLPPGAPTSLLGAAPTGAEGNPPPAATLHASHNTAYIMSAATSASATVSMARSRSAYGESLVLARPGHTPVPTAPQPANHSPGLPPLQAPSGLGIVPLSSGAAQALNLLSGPLSFQSGASGYSSAGPASPALASVQALRMKQAAAAIQVAPPAHSLDAALSPPSTPHTAGSFAPPAPPARPAALAARDTGTEEPTNTSASSVALSASTSAGIAEADPTSLEAEAMEALAGLLDDLGPAAAAAGQQTDMSSLLLGDSHVVPAVAAGGGGVAASPNQHPIAKLKQDRASAEAQQTQRQHANSDFVGDVVDIFPLVQSDTEGVGGGVQQLAPRTRRRAKRVRLLTTGGVSGAASSVLGGNIIALPVPEELLASLQHEALCACSVQRRVVSKGRFHVTLRHGLVRIGGTELLAASVKFALDFSE